MGSRPFSNHFVQPMFNRCELKESLMRLANDAIVVWILLQDTGFWIKCQKLRYWQTGPQNRKCHALCTLGKTSKCWLGFRPICLWSSDGAIVQMWVGTVRACGGLPGVHGDLTALCVTQALPGLINIGLPGYGFELQRQIVWNQVNTKCAYCIALSVLETSQMTIASLANRMRELF